MKQIIDGKCYNTDTAVEIAHYWNGLGTGDFRNRSEWLHKTKKGAWFLYGEGGAMSQWSESNGNTTWGSSGIIPLSETEALAWCEEHAIDADIISTNFKIEEA